MFFIFIRPSSWVHSSDVQVPIATLDQGLEDDFQILPGQLKPLHNLKTNKTYRLLGVGLDSAEEQKWTCKKCTLVNHGFSLICEACCGSKLKSLTITQEMTLKKGEFWICGKCTLKNSLSSTACKVCKTEKTTLEVRVRSRSPSPLHAARKTNRVAPKVSLRTDSDLSRFTVGFPVVNLFKVMSLLTVPNTSKQVQVWTCLLCTFENTKSQFVCDMCQKLRVGTGAPPEDPPRLTQEELSNKHWNYIVRLVLTFGVCV